ncbi:MAG: ABC transporter substrate-binding protein [Deltaproteobacteria bacterium]|nr:ABC transporter substrate-binding protein [Deltaproteobacteria bacterium]
MRNGGWRFTALGLLLLAWGLPALAGEVPVEMRLGHGFAAEEQLWLMKARPDLTPNQGKSYTLKFVPFRGNTDRFNAFIAGQIDGGTVAAFTAIFARAQGISLKLVASLSKESPKGFSSALLTLEESGIRQPADLRGKTIGIVDYKSSTDLYVRQALRGAGLDPDRDVKLVVIPFPAMGNALRTRKIDAGVFPQPFYAAELQKGGVRQLFRSTDAIPFERDLMLVFFSERFLRQHPGPVRDFLSDLVRVTSHYLEQPREGRRALLQAKLVRTPEAIYLNLQDYHREAHARIEVEPLNRLVELIIANGWLEREKKFDAAEMVDLSYLPRS